MFTNTKIALAAAVILGAVSAALANDIGTNPSEAQSTITCPALEGYPDCHPDGGASWAEYSTNSRHPVTARSQHQRKP
jgi:hypothetical protein